jgi:hypothetical protein
VDSSAGVGMIKSVTNTPLTFGVNDSERMRITSGGNVGIGTTTPSEKLTITDGKLFLSTSDPTIGGKIYGYNDTSVNLYSGGLKFQTRYFDGSNYVYADRITINGLGNVGIGTTSPNFLIHSNGSGANSYMQFTSATTGTTSSDGLIIGTGDAGDAVFLNRENTTMQFYTNNTERMRITSSGNVGINTAAPIHKLSVNGKIGGDVYADSFLEFTATTETIVSADGNVVLGYAQNVVVDNEGSLGVGTISPSTCAIVEIQSTNQGFLPPRMRTGERDNILGTPKPGLMIFNTDDEVIQVYTDGSGWRTLAFL